MEKLKSALTFICAIPFVIFAAFVINHCDCETSIFDNLPEGALDPIDAEYQQI